MVPEHPPFITAEIPYDLLSCRAVFKKKSTPGAVLSIPRA